MGVVVQRRVPGGWTAASAMHGTDYSGVGLISQSNGMGGALGGCPRNGRRDRPSQGWTFSAACGLARGKHSTASGIGSTRKGLSLGVSRGCWKSRVIPNDAAADAVGARRCILESASPGGLSFATLSHSPRSGSLKCRLWVTTRSTGAVVCMAVATG